MSYKDKYLKYKNKYLNFKKYIGGSNMEEGGTPECIICLEKYDNNKKKPVSLHDKKNNEFKNEHFICLECYTSMTKNECPTCRGPIINPKKYNFNEQTKKLVEPIHGESVPAIIEEPIDLTEYYENLWSRDDDYDYDDEEDNIPTVGFIGSSSSGPGPLTRSLMNRNSGFTNNSNYDYSNYDYEDNIPTVGFIGSSSSGPGPLARLVSNRTSSSTSSNDRPFGGFTNSSSNDRPTGGFTNSNSNNRPTGGFTNNSNSNNRRGGFF